MPLYPHLRTTLLYTREGTRPRGKVGSLGGSVTCLSLVNFETTSHRLPCHTVGPLVTRMSVPTVGGWCSEAFRNNGGWSTFPEGGCGRNLHPHWYPGNEVDKGGGTGVEGSGGRHPGVPSRVGRRTRRRRVSEVSSRRLVTDPVFSYGSGPPGP